MVFEQVWIEHISQLNLLIFRSILGVDEVLADFKDLFELVDALEVELAVLNDNTEAFALGLVRLVLLLAVHYDGEADVARGEIL